MESQNKYLVSSTYGRAKFLSNHWVEIRPETSYFVLGEIYNFFIEGTFIKRGKLVDINYKYLDVLPESYSFLCYGVKAELSREIIKDRFKSSPTQQKINFKKQRLMILIFESYDEKIKVSQLNFYQNG